MKTKNIMLYGAPGVGKTHNYKRLITMIENGESERTIFHTISKNETTNDFDNSIFETIKNEKRIEFVTFHQSYSYEDFIEGFRPNENGDIELDKKGGVFKRIADKARENLEESQKEKIQVKIIKYRLENKESIRSIAKDFPVTHNTIYKIKNNKLWSDIKID